MSEMRTRPKPEQVFYDTVKILIENQLIHDPNFISDGWEQSYYEKSNELHYGLFIKKAKYILEEIESLKHLIIDDSLSCCGNWDEYGTCKCKSNG